MRLERAYFDRPAPAIVARFEAAPVRIWSAEHAAWWRRPDVGLTRTRAEAGHWTLAQALIATANTYPEQRIYLESTDAAPTPRVAPIDREAVRVAVKSATIGHQSARFGSAASIERATDAVMAVLRNAALPG